MQAPAKKKLAEKVELLRVVSIRADRIMRELAETGDWLGKLARIG